MTNKHISTPASIYVVHHPECEDAERLAGGLYDWFRLGHLSGDSGDAGLPVYFRRRLEGRQLAPPIPFKGAGLNVVVVLVDHRMVIDDSWRQAVVALANEVTSIRNSTSKSRKALLLPVALHSSFYRTGPLYDDYNPVRLLDMTPVQQTAALRRAVTDAAARMLRSENSDHPPPLDVFLSHAKQDGTKIAECIRDSVRTFGQLVPWYDANDLPLGSAWNSPMQTAAANGTAAMVATVTDAYSTRPWCRREATLARTPTPVEKDSRVWRVQPVVAVHQPGPTWTRGLPMLQGVPRIGWNPATRREDVKKIVDRLVLEVLLKKVHCEVATGLHQRHRNSSYCYITWIPDAWTLATLRKRMDGNAGSIRRIVYPGYGMTRSEIEDLMPVVHTFHPKTQLVSFEEAWT